MENSTKRPDFIAKGKGIEFYIEVKEVSDRTDEEQAFENKKSQIIDILNKTNSPNFWLEIKNIDFKTNNQPSARKVVRYLEGKLNEYDPDEVLEMLTKEGAKGIPLLNFEDKNLHIVLKLMPKSKEIRGKNGLRPVAILPSEGFTGGADDSIKSALSKKATKYGELDKPYLICINSKSFRGTDNYDVMDALFGSTAISFSNNPHERDEKLERAMNGFFRDKSGPKYTRVSAVMINRLILGHLKEGKYWFVKHPFAKNELDFEKFEINKTFVKNGKINFEEGKAVKEVLELENFQMSF